MIIHIDNDYFPANGAADEEKECSGLITED